MKIVDYIVTARVAKFKSGTLRLSERQARVRSYGLETVSERKRLYRVVKEIEFKKGEIIGIDKADVDKRRAMLITPVNQVVAEPAKTQPEPQPEPTETDDKTIDSKILLGDN